MDVAEVGAGVRQALVRARCVVLDFDGPVCALHAGRPAADIAVLLRENAERRGEGHLLPVEVRDALDPLELLRKVSDPGLLHRIEAEQTEQEVIAAASARPTAGTAELVTALTRSGRQVAIASNNSSRAVAAYLRRIGVRDFDGHVHGREAGVPVRLKPRPDVLVRALRAAGADAGSAVFVGDAPSDLAAAAAVGVPFVGYARNARKRGLLEADGARLVLDSMEELAALSRGLPPVAVAGPTGPRR